MKKEKTIKEASDAVKVIEPELPKMQELPILTEEQEKLVDANWKLDLRILVPMVSGIEGIDGRSNWGKAIKMYMVGKGYTPTTSKKDVRGPVELNDSQKNFIDQNAHNLPTMTEMMRLLFPNEKCHPSLSNEAKAVMRYIKENHVESVDVWNEPVDEKEYRPPASIINVIGRCNEYIGNAVDPSRSLYDLNKLRSSDEKNLRALVSFMKRPRFIYQASQYSKKIDRRLFEATFISYTHDKAADLSLAEVDMYIVSATKTIEISRMKFSIEAMDEKVNECLMGADDEQGTKAKISMGLVELVNNSRDKLSKAEKQLEDILANLEGVRSKRISARDGRNSSILNLFDKWVQEESRLQIIELGKQEKYEDAEEVKRIKGMADVLGIIAGQHTDEASIG